MCRILFFDDYPYASENQLFRMNLEDELRPGLRVSIVPEKTVSGFENAARRFLYDIVILDIMAEAPGKLLQTGTGLEVPSSQTGIELLRRCRVGEYGRHYTLCPVFMRSARGETDIRDECLRSGASGYFQVGGEDEQLIEAIRVALEAQKAAIKEADRPDTDPRAKADEPDRI
ncbi:MAG: hypothetical protein NT031_11735 [Planctomycetota bacterium]|nr:hypothetical protein [Planctomycetota bacterium]